MKKVIASAALVIASLALVACSTAQSSESANSGNAVFQKGVTK